MESHYLLHKIDIQQLEKESTSSLLAFQPQCMNDVIPLSVVKVEFKKECA